MGGKQKFKPKNKPKPKKNSTSSEKNLQRTSFHNNASEEEVTSLLLESTRTSLNTPASPVLSSQRPPSGSYYTSISLPASPPPPPPPPPSAQLLTPISTSPLHTPLPYSHSLTIVDEEERLAFPLRPSLSSTSASSSSSPTPLLEVDPSTASRYRTLSSSSPTPSLRLPTLSSNSSSSSSSLSPPALKDFPFSVFFIIGNEFCERFTFYGIKAILFMYLTQSLRVSPNLATAVVHAFNVVAYCCTLFGAILSDAYWGRFKTIFILSLVYCLGSVLLSVSSAIETLATWGLIVGLGLLALGTGGIKPCVSAFGGDQLPVSHLTLYFSWFYFAINSGSLVSMILTPLLRSHACLGHPHCFPLAFGVPSILMCVSTLIFLSGSHFYKMQPPSGNMVMEVIKAIKAAWMNQHRVPKQSHWMDYALFDGRFSSAFIHDVKQLLAVLYVFLPLPIFWTLYDQQASRWTAQALQLNPHFKVFGWNLTLQPDQMQVTNAILILILIPIFQSYVYPYFPSWTPLKKMNYGMVCTGLSFFVASYVQTLIDETSVLNEAKVCESHCLPMYLQLPQYLLVTVGEILFSITGLEFAYQVAPHSMKSVCQSAWLLTVALGNVYVILMVGLGDLAMAKEFLVYGTLMMFACALFHWMTRNMKTERWRHHEDVIGSPLLSPHSD
ncbi:hypothetical protein HMI54_015157 [Coelomomyces lativittatus]|nr:hypothetical protein HMI56_007562 [Coelomomyces lativittatus]KAJ1513193.1 hypothetical protein HMI55_005818 [Coelomomyces lativittatus]KAJ1513230.1 hypothetical protein HMI54_015157 [Coelomomyces lativittatus]